MNKRSIFYLLVLTMLMGMLALSMDAPTNGLEPPRLQPPIEPTRSKLPIDGAGDAPPLTLPPSASPNLNAATFPYFDGFESGVLGLEWTEYTTTDGRIRVSPDYPHSGVYSLLLDDSVDDTTYSAAAVILTVDLSGQTAVELDFWWREFSDEDDAEDGVFISDDDGLNWYPAYSFNGSNNSWTQAIVDIDAKATENSLVLNDHFQIKFQFYDNWGITSDGYALDDVTVQAPPYRVYLPALFNNAGPPTTAPVLNPIDNAAGNYDYTVSWSTAEKATEYTLEEDDNVSFSSPTVAYQGVLTSTNISGQDLGTFYYRVKASNSFGESDWSNIESTTVTVAKPLCPQAGSWSGTTNQSYAISFNVVQSPSCEVQSLSIRYRVTCTFGSYFTATTNFLSDQTITNDHFDTSGSTPRVIGDFTSTTSANGTWSYSGINPYNPIEYCTASGSWTASY